MIVRILHEGQFRIPEEQRPELDGLDHALGEAVEARDAAAFGPALQTVLKWVRERGERVQPDELVASDVVLPCPDDSMEEVAALLAREGLLP